MRRRSIPTLIPLVLIAACDEPQPWQAAQWRPVSPPQRIVLGSVLAAESLLQVLPHDRIAGVHRFVADPGYCLDADRAAGLRLLGAEPEELLAARPDLVLVDAYTRPETLALLSAAGVPVVRTLDPHSFEDIAANLRLLGRVTWQEDGTQQLVIALQQQLAAVRAQAGEISAWRVLSIDGALHTYGQGSLFDAIAEAAGARNVAAERGVGAFRRLDVEEVLAFSPDAIVLARASGETDEVPPWLRYMPGLELLPCVQRGRVVQLPGPLLSTTSHHLVAAAARLQRVLASWGRP